MHQPVGSVEVDSVGLVPYTYVEPSSLLPACVTLAGPSPGPGDFYELLVNKRCFI